MGNFYTNYTVRNSDPQAVAAALKGRNAIVTPAKNGTIVVYDEESDTQDEETLTGLAGDLSSQCNCAVLAVLNHDDDILLYWLYDRGRQIDTFNSQPGYFDGGDDTPSGGDAALLCQAFGSAKVSQVEAILHPDESAVFALDQHHELVEALGISDYGVGCGFNYIDQGELPEGLGEDDLIRID